jgi:hypothetical protein
LFLPLSPCFPQVGFFSHYFPVRIPDTDAENKGQRGASGLTARLAGLHALLYAFEWENFAGDGEFWAPCSHAFHVWVRACRGSASSGSATSCEEPFKLQSYPDSNLIDIGNQITEMKVNFRTGTSPELKTIFSLLHLIRVSGVHMSVLCWSPGALRHPGTSWVSSLPSTLTSAHSNSSLQTNIHKCPPIASVASPNHSEAKALLGARTMT